MRFMESNGLKIYLTEEDQRHISSQESIAKNMGGSNILAFDIYEGMLPVGFAMLRKFSEGGYFLWNFAIDSRFQGQGYGQKSLSALLKLLKTDYDAHIVTTTYLQGNTHARYVYEKAGFVETDVVDESGVHEVNMAIHL